MIIHERRDMICTITEKFTVLRLMMLIWTWRWFNGHCDIVCSILQQWTTPVLWQNPSYNAPSEKTYNPPRVLSREEQNKYSKPDRHTNSLSHPTISLASAFMSNANWHSLQNDCTITIAAGYTYRIGPEPSCPPSGHASSPLPTTTSAPCGLTGQISGCW